MCLVQVALVLTNVFSNIETLDVILIFSCKESNIRYISEVIMGSEGVTSIVWYK